MNYMPNIDDVHDYAPKQDDFCEQVTAGLGRERKELPCKFFYDERGSKLFDAICALDEYYPTRTEERLLRDNGDKIAALMGKRAELIEFGCGSLKKVRTLLEAMDEPARFVPIDISKEHLVSAAEDLAKDFPDIAITPVCADFSEPIPLPNGSDDEVGKTVGFFPGSTIGNFSRPEAVEFLKSIAEIVGEGGDLVIGVDLKKDPEVLNAAYNDAEGVTAEFNLNLLHRINRELGANFDLASFEHEAYYAADEGRVEMHLKSTRDQEVAVAGDTYRFEAGETIHTENSYKYGLEEFKDHAAQAGFNAIDSWVDEERLFSVHYLTVK